MGRRQAVRQRTLTPSFGCSNHFAPAKNTVHQKGVPCFCLWWRMSKPVLSGVRALSEKRKGKKREEKCASEKALAKPKLFRCSQNTILVHYYAKKLCFSLYKASTKNNKSCL